MGIRDRPTSPRSPWQNGYAERLIGSIRRDRLDHVIVFSERHLRHLLLCYNITMAPARIYPWRKKHRSRAPSIAPGTFFVAQSWADCITNMPGFNLRQAQYGRMTARDAPNGGKRRRLRSHYRRRKLLKKRDHLLAPQLLAQNHRLGCVHPVKLEEALRRIHPNSANLFHRRSPFSEICNDLILAHAMPSRAVHPNRPINIERTTGNKLKIGYRPAWG
jgi:hypothetical protein